MTGEFGVRLCAGRGCNKAGTKRLWISLFNKQGFFCKSCADYLVHNSLAIVKEDNDNDINGWRQDVEVLVFTNDSDSGPEATNSRRKDTIRDHAGVQL